MKAKTKPVARGEARALADRISHSAAKVWKGSQNAHGWRFAIVVSQFNLVITQRLLLGALDGLRRCGVERKNIEVIWTPGAYEIPMAAKKVASRKEKKVSGIVCLGAVIRGETPHFEYISAECASGIAAVGLKLEIPIAFGVLTTDTVAQALARAGGKLGNKGWDAALSTVEMVNLFQELS